MEELGIVLTESPDALGRLCGIVSRGKFAFLNWNAPLQNGKIAITGRLGYNLTVDQGQKASYISALNALAVAKHQLGNLDRLKKLVKLTVLMVTTEYFEEHAVVADGASKLFVQLFGAEIGHTRVVYGVQSMPIGAPVIVETIFEIE